MIQAKKKLRKYAKSYQLIWLQKTLKLLVIDLSKKIEKKFLDLCDKKTLIILNKTDIVSKKDLNSKIKYLNKNEYYNISTISALKGIGISKLLQNIENFIKKTYQDVFLGEPVITRNRHREALKKCLNNLKKIDNNKSPELNAEDLRIAINSLGNITGKYDVEKLLDIVFKDFCIGK